MDHTAITHERLINQHIVPADQQSPTDVIRNLVALQAQDYPGALWSIGLRMPEATQSIIEKAIADRQIVRTWPMRGTLHFVLAEDIRWLLKLLTPRIVSGTAARRRNLELDDAVFAKAAQLVARALRGGQPMLRSELLGLLDANGIVTADQRGYHILFQLSMDGLICFGPHQGKQPTFVLLDEWIPVSRELTHEESLKELAERFFTGHGPATEVDLARWAGLPLGEVRKGLAAANDALANIEVGGSTYWHAKGTIPEKLFLEARQSAVLLPGFDEYVLAYKDRSLMLELVHSHKIVPGNNGMFMPTIVIGGQIVGTWKRTAKTSNVELRLQPFDNLSASQSAAIAAAAERYGAFLGKQVVIASE